RTRTGTGRGRAEDVESRAVDLDRGCDADTIVGILQLEGYFLRYPRRVGVVHLGVIGRPRIGRGCDQARSRIDSDQSHLRVSPDRHGQSADQGVELAIHRGGQIDGDGRIQRVLDPRGVIRAGRGGGIEPDLLDAHVDMGVLSRHVAADRHVRLGGATHQRYADEQEASHPWIPAPYVPHETPPLPCLSPYLRVAATTNRARGAKYSAPIAI